MFPIYFKLIELGKQNYRNVINFNFYYYKLNKHSLLDLLFNNPKDLIQLLSIQNV